MEKIDVKKTIWTMIALALATGCFAAETNKTEHIATSINKLAAVSASTGKVEVVKISSPVHAAYADSILLHFQTRTNFFNVSEIEMDFGMNRTPCPLPRKCREKLVQEPDGYAGQKLGIR